MSGVWFGGCGHAGAFWIVWANNPRASFLADALARRLQFIAVMLTFLTLCLLHAAPFKGTFHADQGVVTLTNNNGEVRGLITWAVNGSRCGVKSAKEFWSGAQSTATERSSTSARRWSAKC